MDAVEATPSEVNVSTDVAEIAPAVGHEVPDGITTTVVVCKLCEKAESFKFKFNYKTKTGGKKRRTSVASANT